MVFVVTETGQLSAHVALMSVCHRLASKHLFALLLSYGQEGVGGTRTKTAKIKQIIKKLLLKLIM